MYAKIHFDSDSHRCYDECACEYYEGEKVKIIDPVFLYEKAHELNHILVELSGVMLYIQKCNLIVL